MVWSLWTFTYLIWKSHTPEQLKGAVQEIHCLILSYVLSFLILLTPDFPWNSSFRRKLNKKINSTSRKVHNTNTLPKKTKGFKRILFKWKTSKIYKCPKYSVVRFDNKYVERTKRRQKKVASGGRKTPWTGDNTEQIIQMRIWCDSDANRYLSFYTWK